MAASGRDLHDRPQFPAIPYGLAYFKGIRREGCLYVDKTRFLHALEQERFVFFTPWRRWSKTSRTTATSSSSTRWKRTRSCFRTT